MGFEIDENDDLGAAVPQAVMPRDSAPADVLSIINETVEAAIARARTALSVYEEAIGKMTEEATLLNIVDDKSLNVGVSLGIRAKKLAKQIDDRAKAIKAPGKKLDTAVSNFAKVYTVNLDKIESTIKQKKANYEHLEKIRKQEAQRKIEEETRKFNAMLKAEADKAGVVAGEIETPIVDKEQTVIRTEDGIAFKSEYWKFEAGPVHHNDPSLPKRKRVVAYAGSSKESMYAIGEKAGLAGAVLDKFMYALSEVAFELEIGDDGWARIVSVDGNLLPIIPAEFLMPNDKEIRKHVNAGRREIPGVKIWREDKEVFK